MKLESLRNVSIDTSVDLSSMFSSSLVLLTTLVPSHHYSVMWLCELVKDVLDNRQLRSLSMIDSCDRDADQHRLMRYTRLDVLQLYYQCAVRCYPSSFHVSVMDAAISFASEVSETIIAVDSAQSKIRKHFCNSILADDVMRSYVRDALKAVSMITSSTPSNCNGSSSHAMQSASLLGRAYELHDRLSVVY